MFNQEMAETVKTATRNHYIGLFCRHFIGFIVVNLSGSATGAAVGVQRERRNST